MGADTGLTRMYTGTGVIEMNVMKFKTDKWI